MKWIIPLAIVLGTPSALADDLSRYREFQQQQHNEEVERMMREQNDLLRRQEEERAADRLKEESQREPIIVRVPVEKVVTKPVFMPTTEERMLKQGTWFLASYAADALIYVEKSTFRNLGRYRSGWIKMVFGERVAADFVLVDCKTLTVEYPLLIDELQPHRIKADKGSILAVALNQVCAKSFGSQIAAN